MKMRPRNRKQKTLLYICIAALAVITTTQLSAYSLSDIIKMWDSLQEKGTNNTGGKNFDDITPVGSNATNGEFTVVSWNITGKPSVLDGISGSEAQEVGKIVRDWNFDIVGFQEVWIKKKYEKVASKLTNSQYPGRSKLWKAGKYEWGDGLWTIAKHPLDKANYKRDVFSKCAGGPHQLKSIGAVSKIIDVAKSGESPDCLAEKGFSMSPVVIKDNLVVHVYNTHMNTSSKHDDKDIEAIKGSQFEELADAINDWSAGYPVILMGDFNSKLESSDPERAYQVEQMEDFIDETGMTFACKVVSDELGCNKVDQIAYRSNSKFTLEATRFWRPEDGKVDNTHSAVAAVIEYDKN